MREGAGDITLRAMREGDIGAVPIGCQGDVEAVRARIRDIGSCAILAFDGARHVGQLQFRRYAADTRSPTGMREPLYWGDFGAHAPVLPAQSLAVFCYHVGQLDDTEGRDPRYHGRGIGLALLDHFLAWASEHRFAAVTAKATPPERAVMGFMGGQPADAYAERGFEVTASWIDTRVLGVVREKALVPPGMPDDRAALVSCCVKRL
jgi:GNAT superfamily N-acetyltransferase